MEANMIQHGWLKEKINESEVFLIGIGAELSLQNHSEEELQEIYEQIRRLLHGKIYFIITTNTDDALLRSTFKPKRMVAPCGSIHRWQCKAACTKTLWEEKPTVCPNCGGEVVENVWTNRPYVEEGYLAQWQAYGNFLSIARNYKLLLLELGCDFSAPTPQIIRFPFERIVRLQQNAYLMRVGSQFSQIPEEIAKQAVGVADCVESFLKQMNESM